MDEIINLTSQNDLEALVSENELVELTDGLLIEARTIIDNGKVLSVPIAELSTLGASVASMIPALNTVTQTAMITNDGLFKIANFAAGDTLKMAKNGNAWGAMKTATGGSKMVQLTETGPVSVTTQSVAAFNPATMMMAVTLYSIENNLTEIAETQKRTLKFLEVEKESKIEADKESLLKILTNYKYSWDNKRWMDSHHNLIVDIQNRSEGNINFYQEQVKEAFKKKQFLVDQNKVDSILNELQKSFQYYRLSLYNFSLASLLEIMLSENFKEEYIAGSKEKIEERSVTYRNLFEECSIRLERIGETALDSSVVKGLGVAEKAIGNLISSVPLIKKGSVDEFLKDQGTHLQMNAVKMETKAVREFASVANPGTSVVSDRMEDLIQIYEHTTQICFDDKKIYLLAE